jgi:hypothetical protein
MTQFKVILSSWKVDRFVEHQNGFLLKGERVSAARRTRTGGGGGQGEDGAIAVYLSARSTSKSSAVEA